MIPTNNYYTPTTNLLIYIYDAKSRSFRHLSAKMWNKNHRRVESQFFADNWDAWYVFALGGIMESNEKAWISRMDNTRQAFPSNTSLYFRFDRQVTRKTNGVSVTDRACNFTWKLSVSRLEALSNRTVLNQPFRAISSTFETAASKNAQCSVFRDVKGWQVLWSCFNESI